MSTSFSYNNLKVGDKFKVGGDGSVYVRARGGFYRVGKDGHGTVGAIWRLDHPNSPVTSGLQAVEYVPPNTLSDFSRGLDAAAARRDDERKKLNDLLEARQHEFVPDADDPRMGIGYWRMDNGAGVVSYRRYANGFDPYSRLEYPSDLIDLLVKVRADER